MKTATTRARSGRRRVKAMIAVTIALVMAAAGTSGASASGEIGSSPGTDYYLATEGGWRYGPAFIQDSAGLHVYSCSPGTGGVWDVIRYSNSTDGGTTWSPDQVVLTPNAGSADKYSACDPGIVRFGGYYYLAYTSTVDNRGTDNDVFVARSTSRTGPFQKWNGSGWGGDPQPIVSHTGPAWLYGAGEPSLVVVGSTLYIFYSWISADPSTGKLVHQTRLSTAPTTSGNWPAAMAYQGISVERRVDQGQDSDDIKWVPAWNTFIAVNSAQRFGPLSYVQGWQSPNGLNFQPMNVDSSYMKRYLHNVGISGDASGHLDVSAQNRIGYAYGSSWGRWNTSIDPISLSQDARPAAPQIYSSLTGSGSVRLEFQTDSKATSYTVRYGTSPGSFTASVSGVTSSPYTLSGLTNGTTYYVTMTATGSTGTSDLGQQVAVTPQNWTGITLASPTARSTSGSLVPARAIDGNPSTFYSSAGSTSPTATEWLQVDTGSIQNIGRVMVANRHPEQLGGPAFGAEQYAVVQTSTDGSTWTTVDTRLNSATMVDSAGVTRNYLTFPRPVSARYVRIYATRLNADDVGDYYLQVAELGVDKVPGGPLVSSALSTHPKTDLTDASTSTVWSSGLSTSAATTQWAGIDLGSNQAVTSMILTPRASGLAFPVDFSLQSSADGTTWSTISGQTYTAYANPGSRARSFAFSAPVTARYFRILATKLSADDVGNYALQLGDLRVGTSMRVASATASSVANSDYPVANAFDQVGSTAWSSAGHSTASATEWFQLDLGSSRAFQNIWIDPHNQAFPSSFTLSSSTDGTTWTRLPGQTYTVYTDPAGAGTAVPPTQQFHLTTPVTARYVRVTATSLRPDGFGNYYFQFRDIRVTG